MRHAVYALAIGLVTVPGPALAGQLEDACSARGTWNADTCACMQGVADRSLAADQQELAAAYFGRQITSAQIAAQYGAAVAEEFLVSLANFMNESTTECGAP